MQFALFPPFGEAKRGKSISRNSKQQQNTSTMSQDTSTSQIPDTSSHMDKDETQGPTVDNTDQQNEQNQDDEEIDFVFLCKLDNTRIMHNILSALLFKKDGQIATITITSSGIKFTVEESKSFQGNAFLGEELFQEYKYTPADPDQQEVFKINFSIFMDCLSIYGTSTFVAMQMGYGGYGHSLVIMLEESGVITHCGLRTLESEEVHNFNFRASTIPNKIIMEAEYLKDAFDELDWSSSLVTVTLSPEAPFFRLSTSGPNGSCQVDYPKDSEVFELFECTETQSNSFKLTLLQPAVKALAIAAKSQLRMNQIGVLSMQHMIKSEDKNISFVDFYIAPEEDNVDQS